MTITGHDIGRHCERLGVPEGMEIVPSAGTIEIFAEGGVTASGGQMHLAVFADVCAPDEMRVNLNHPRAMEAAALLLRAYRDARLDEGQGDRS